MKAYVDKRKCYSDNRLCKPITECPAQAIIWAEDEKEPFSSSKENIKTRKIPCFKWFTGLVAFCIAAGYILKFLENSRVRQN